MPITANEVTALLKLDSSQMSRRSFLAAAALLPSVMAFKPREQSHLEMLIGRRACGCPATGVILKTSERKFTCGLSVFHAMAREENLRVESYSCDSIADIKELKCAYHKAKPDELPIPIW